MRQYVCSFLLLILAGGSSSVLADQTAVASGSAATGHPDTAVIAAPDAEFFEITLKPESVVAYDSLGNRWEYDFTREAFVLSMDDDGSAPGGGEHTRKYPPVEERCTEEKQLADFERSVLVGYDEFVVDDIIAYGKVTVKGWVQGNVVSQKGPVVVTESGRIDGDIRSPAIIVKEGAVVSGRRVQTGQFEIPVELITHEFSTRGIWIASVFTGVFLLLGFLIISLIPKQVQRMDDCARRHPVRAILTGFIFVFVLPVVIGLLAVTIVGIALLPLLAIAILASLVVAMIILGGLIDRTLISRLLPGVRSPMYRGLTGILMVMALWIFVAVNFGSTHSQNPGFGSVLLLVVSILVSSLELLLGMGVALLTRFGFRQFLSRRDRMADTGGDAPLPAPPPLSPAPSGDGVSLPRDDRHSAESSEPQDPRPPLSSDLQ